MNDDLKMLLKFAIAIVAIGVFLIFWFLTIGSPTVDDEDGAVGLLTNIVGAAASKISALTLVF
jgi:nitrogen fixation-related uncharacterized protein